eukprot:313441-Amorphochlora_amoeboformis.AAC.1
MYKHTYTSDIDAILARNSRVVTMGGEEGEAGSLAGNSTFSKATFVAEDEKVDINDPNFWTKLGACMEMRHVSQKTSSCFPVSRNASQDTYEA